MCIRVQAWKRSGEGKDVYEVLIGYIIDCDLAKGSKHIKISCTLPAYFMVLVNKPFLHFNSSYLEIMKIIVYGNSKIT
jgi:hypothetical protein